MAFSKFSPFFRVFLYLNKTIALTLPYNYFNHFLKNKLGIEILLLLNTTRYFITKLIIN